MTLKKILSYTLFFILVCPNLFSNEYDNNFYGDWYLEGNDGEEPVKIFSFYPGDEFKSVLFCKFLVFLSTPISSTLCTKKDNKCSIKTWYSVNKSTINLIVEPNEESLSFVEVTGMTFQFSPRDEKENKYLLKVEMRYKKGILSTFINPITEDKVVQERIPVYHRPIESTISDNSG